MNRWIKTAAPLGITAMLLTALIVGGRGGASTGATDCATSMDSGGRLAAGKTATFGMKFCSDPTHNFALYVTWGRYDDSKDLAIHVTDPAGNEFWVDNDPNAGESFFAYAPLAEGDWTVQIINQGSRSVNYDLLMGFG